MIPIRFVAMSYNLWKNKRWPQREPALRAILRATPPDLLCLQELFPETRTVIDEELPGHSRVEESFEGWTREGNIYWNRQLFDHVSHGAEDVNLQSEFRRLFWARLRLTADGRTLLVATAHYTYQGNHREATEGFSPRIDQARSTVSGLARLAREDEPVLFMGDLNDCANPVKVLRAAGYQDSFTGIGRVPRPTYPAMASALEPPEVRDWQLSRGPVRILGSDVIDFSVGDVAPSDHKPIMAVYGLDPVGG